MKFIHISLKALMTSSFLFLSTLNVAEAGSVQCRTESNGYGFDHTSEDYSQSQQAVLTACQNSRETNLQECSTNLTCDQGQGNRPGGGDLIEGIKFAMVGTWKTSTCANCYLQVYLYGNQLYGDMIPWRTNNSYSNGLQPITFLSDTTVSFRNDTFRITTLVDQYGGPTGFTLDRLSSNNGNVDRATKNFFQNFPTPLPPRPTPVPQPRPDDCPWGTVWDWNLDRCVTVHNQPRPQNCPPGTIWDYDLDRCVSVNTPPRPNPQNCPPGTVWDWNIDRCVSVNTPPRPNPQNCPPGTVWDYQLDRCISVVTPPRPLPPRPLPPPPLPPRPLPPRPIPVPQPPSCPPGTIWDSSIDRCVSVNTPPRPQPVPQPIPQPPRPIPVPQPIPQPPRPIPVPQPIPQPPIPQPQPPRPEPPRPLPPPPAPLPVPRPGGNCPPGTVMDPVLGRCVVG